ncbi:hypothetical protein SRB5_31210 [Streptomyces sp. RB5]|uniref:Uncharacterized protein n=1 Tax=Streptomyces smaragdinus TaxID=2585196 RepID=A0A7K0CHL9_9ACTN|nr:hypothetical protein [Streptomyces smaragdinus]MQY12981.1 hypothetical protein [Streptomyces smaragdinus]
MSHSGASGEPQAQEHGGVQPVGGEPWGSTPAPYAQAPGQDPEATQYIPPVGDAWPAQAPQPQQPPHQPPGGDAEATQYLPPVPGQGFPGVPPQPAPDEQYRMQSHEAYEESPRARHAANDFDALYRDAPAGPAETQPIPRFQPQHQGGGYDPAPPHGGGYDDGYYDDDVRPGIPRWALVALGTAACVVIGLTAGWLMGGSDGGKDEPTGGGTASTSAEPSQEELQPAADPAKAQAGELSKLLETSNDSRTSVISAVDNIKKCDNLAGAARDLRAAARQRNNLVTQLQQLTIDKVPDSGELSQALTNAWKASASADAHYANWADQMARSKRGCAGGHGVRGTSESRAGDRQSGTASQAKQNAAKLWNPTAQKYGLPTRQSSDL